MGGRAGRPRRRRGQGRVERRRDNALAPSAEDWVRCLHPSAAAPRFGAAVFGARPVDLGRRIVIVRPTDPFARASACQIQAPCVGGRDKRRCGAFARPRQATARTGNSTRRKVVGDPGTVADTPSQRRAAATGRKPLAGSPRSTKRRLDGVTGRLGACGGNPPNPPGGRNCPESDQLGAMDAGRTGDGR